jgi:hypothetical protein
MLFITHALPKNLQVDEIVQVGLSRAPSHVDELKQFEAIGSPA